MNGGNHSSHPKTDTIVTAWKFLAAFLVVFFLMSIVLFAIDFYPESVGTGSSDEIEEETTSEDDAAATIQYPIESPSRIVINAIGVDTLIENPVSTDITVLDNALLKGAVRYPASALLGENAGMLVFGHQSGLPVVKNQAFKAFNNLQNLKGGEEIVVYSGTAAYRYRVTKIEHKSAADGWVELSTGTRTLTLTTCDSFGKKTDRYVVTAEFISRTELTNTN